MPAVTLVPITPHLERRLTTPDEAARHYDIRIGDSAPLAREVVRQVLRMAPVTDARFGGYLAVDDASRELIGTCSFKGEPDHEGAAEIAYFSFPSFEGRGYGTAMAEALLAVAAAVPRVTLVIAHTLPERNASTRILEKVGFRFGAVVEDPADGTIWRWELPLKTAPPAAPPMRV
jgi:[ribosomal protein S5]-alanine N-acetyltransferase